MGYHEILKTMPMAEDYSKKDTLEDLENLVEFSKEALKAFESGENFHGQILQALEMAHRLSEYYGGPEEFEIEPEVEEEPETSEVPQGKYGIFDRDDLGSSFTKHSVPVKAWRGLYDDLHEAIEEIKEASPDYEVSVGQIRLDESGVAVTDIVYTWTQEKLEDEEG